MSFWKNLLRRARHEHDPLAQLRGEIAKAERIRALPNAHPESRFWARSALPQLRERLAMAERRVLEQARQAALRERTRPQRGPEHDGGFRNPLARNPAPNVESKPLGQSMQWRKY